MLYMILANVRHFMHFLLYVTTFIVFPIDLALLMPIDGLSYYYPEGRHQTVQTPTESNHETEQATD